MEQIRGEDGGGGCMQGRTALNFDLPPLFQTESWGQDEEEEGKEEGEKGEEGRGE